MAGLEFVPVTDRVSYVKAATGIGVAVNGKRALLIDTGLDENLVRKVLNHLRDRGVTVEAIVNTHSHADHIGGNAFTVARTGAEVHAPALEAAFIETPALEPLSLYGASAPKALQTKFLQAPPSRVTHPVTEAGEREIAGMTVRFDPIPGHSLHQLAVAVDGVCFLGDALLPEAIVEKYGVVFAVDPALQRESALRIAGLGHAHHVTYHGGLVEDLKGMVEANVRAIDDTNARLLAALDSPAGAEDLFQRLALELGWSMGPEQYHLNFATIKAYLAALEREGCLQCRVERARLLWHRV